MKKISILLSILISLSSLSCSDNDTKVLIATPYGNIKVKLYNDTPRHRDNFIAMVNEGKADALVFDRIVPDFIIQGGKMMPDSLKKTIPAEFAGVFSKRFHKSGALGAARWGNEHNPNMESDATQFYIVTGEQFADHHIEELKQKGYTFTDEQIEIYGRLGGAPSLDGKYTVFGEVIEGMDVVYKITKVKTDGKETPLKNIEMRLKIID